MDADLHASRERAGGHAMTNVIQLFPPSNEEYRHRAIVVFEARTKIYTPSAVLDNWALLWLDYVEEFKPPSYDETWMLWFEFTAAHPYPGGVYRVPTSGLVLLWQIMIWMALAAGFGAWLAW